MKVKEMILEALLHVDESTFQNKAKTALAETPCTIQGMVDDGEGFKLMSVRFEY